MGRATRCVRREISTPKFRMPALESTSPLEREGKRVFYISLILDALGEDTFIAHHGESRKEEPPVPALKELTVHWRNKWNTLETTHARYRRAGEEATLTVSAEGAKGLGKGRDQCGPRGEEVEWKEHWAGSQESWALDQILA